MIGIVSHYMTSGAAQLSISFDSGYHGCTASVQYGHETGKTMKIKGLDGETYTITGAPSASGASCSIREGNAFAQ